MRDRVSTFWNLKVACRTEALSKDEADASEWRNCAKQRGGETDHGIEMDAGGFEDVC